MCITRNDCASFWAFLEARRLMSLGDTVVAVGCAFSRFSTFGAQNMSGFFNRRGKSSRRRFRQARSAGFQEVLVAPDFQDRPFPKRLAAKSVASGRCYSGDQSRAVQTRARGFGRIVGLSCCDWFGGPAAPWLCIESADAGAERTDGGLKIVRLAGAQQVQGLARQLEFFPRDGVVKLDWRKVSKWTPRISSQRTNLAAFTASSTPIVRKLSPTQSAANFSSGGFADEIHVHRQRGVAGEIKIAFC